jgi:hypothetical protein
MGVLLGHLTERPLNHLVLFAKYGSPSERSRFHNESWIFCDLYRYQHEVDLSVHSRFLIQTNLESDNRANLSQLLEALPNSFNYIADDDLGQILDSKDRITEFVNALRPGGVIALHYNNVDYSLFGDLPEALRAAINYEIIPAFTPMYAGCIPYGQQLMGLKNYPDDELNTAYVNRMNDMLGAMGLPVIPLGIPKEEKIQAIKDTTELIATRWVPATVTPDARNAEVRPEYTAVPYMYNFVIKRLH